MYLIQAEVPGAGRGKKRIVNINNYDFLKPMLSSGCPWVSSKNVRQFDSTVWFVA